MPPFCCSLWSQTSFASLRDFASLRETGHSAEREGNAIALARTPHFDEWHKEYPNTIIEASGQYVGLKAGQMGNSEVGHLNIGTGRIVRMDTSRIDHAIETGEFFRNDILIQAMEHAKSRASALHFIGLVSHGGVHSSQEHLYALLRMARERNVDRVFVHAFLDGRDTAPNSGAVYVAELIDKMREYAIGRVASVVGRYYAMDRYKRWERTELARSPRTISHSLIEARDRRSGSHA